MTKLRKQRRKKSFRTNVNRKRLRNKLYSVGKVTCQEIKKAWEDKKSVRTNLEEMGLVYDPNKNFKIPNRKQDIKIQMKSTTKWREEALEVPQIPSKAFVAEELEKEAKAPRERMFRLPAGQVEWITYLMDKYGTDFKAMTRDKRNHYQETWKQIRSKIKTFMGVPEQYAEYLEKKGLLEKDSDEEYHMSGFNMDSDSD